MDTILLVKVLGVYVFVSGLFLLTRGKTVPMLLKDFFEHRAVMWLSGLILILIGGLIALDDSIYQSWVTVLGWAVLFKGVIYILAPEMFMRFTTTRFRSFWAIAGVLAMVLGYLLFRL